MTFYLYAVAVIIVVLLSFFDFFEFFNREVAGASLADDAGVYLLLTLPHLFLQTRGQRSQHPLLLIRNTTRRSRGITNRFFTTTTFQTNRKRPFNFSTG